MAYFTKGFGCKRLKKTNLIRLDSIIQKQMSSRVISRNGDGNDLSDIFMYKCHNSDFDYKKKTKQIVFYQVLKKRNFKDPLIIIILLLKHNFPTNLFSFHMHSS